MHKDAQDATDAQGYNLLEKCRARQQRFTWEEHAELFIVSKPCAWNNLDHVEHGTVDRHDLLVDIQLQGKNASRDDCAKEMFMYVCQNVTTKGQVQNGLNKGACCDKIKKKHLPSRYVVLCTWRSNTWSHTHSFTPWKLVLVQWHSPGRQRWKESSGAM